MEETQIEQEAALAEAPAAPVSTYSEANIQVLEGLDAVRKRPGMYIGDVGDRGLHHLIYEVVDNSVDEALAGFCDRIEVTLHADGSCSVLDNGRGIPTGPHPVKKISTLEVVLCTLHAGGKFDKNTYKVSGGLHGVGVSCVNALSTKLIAEIKREGKVFYQEYHRGAPVAPIATIGETTSTGTSMRFYPDETIFQTVRFRRERVAERLRELAYLNPTVTIILRDEREAEPFEEVLHYPGGLKDFIAYIDDNKKALIAPILISGVGTSETDGSETPVDICFQYNDGISETLLSYVNDINTIEGGTHVTGFRASLTRILNTYASKNNLVKASDKIQLSAEDFREGLTAIISVKVAEPLFEGQTKTKLGNSDVEKTVRSIVSEQLATFLDSNPAIGKQVISKAVTAAEARIAARKSRDLVYRKNALTSSSLPGKLADCSKKTPEDCEIFIVEGDSAGGSAKQGRFRDFQAILPLKGKILNVQKARIHKVVENDEIRAIIAALGTGFGEDFDISKIRYGKIILMADADVDGSHIRTLLLTFFFTYMRELIDSGKLYIAQPPLYKLKKGKKEYYAKSDAERDELIERIRKEAAMRKGTAQTAEIDEEETATPAAEEATTKDGITISRFKGLGEMNPDQLRDTTMDPEARTLLQVNVENAAAASRMFEILMGDQVEPRRNFIEKNAQYVKNLDI